MQRFDKLAVFVASGSSRRRLITGFGALALGALLGREAKAKPSGNKGNSGPNSNADCNADCAHKFKAKGKHCQDKKKAAKKECLQKIKDDQTRCREQCALTDTMGTAAALGVGSETGSAPAPAPETGTGTETTPETEGEFGILAKASCEKGAKGDAFCQSTVANSDCLKGTCTHKVREGQYRCEYTRQPWLCPGEYCCPYRANPDAPHLQFETSGQCVERGAGTLEQPETYFCEQRRDLSNP